MATRLFLKFPDQKNKGQMRTLIRTQVMHVASDIEARIRNWKNTYPGGTIERVDLK